MVVHNETESRFELRLGDGELAVLEYRIVDNTMIFTHTGVPAIHEGRGYGGQLARAGLDYARNAGMQIVPACSFIAAFIRRNPEYAGSVPEAHRTAAPSCQIRRS